LEEAGLIDKVITRDHQEMHHTKLYQDLRSKMKEEVEQKVAEALKQVDEQKTEPVPQPIDQKKFADDVERNYAPVLEEMAEAGAFEPEVVRAYPRFVSQTAHQIESLRLAGQGIIGALKEIKEYVGMQQANEARETGMAKLNSSMQELASQPLYAELAKDEERQSFIEWMKADDNPQPWKHLDIDEQLSRPEVLAGAYAAYRATRPAPAAPPAAAPASDTRERAKLAAGGGGGGGRRPAKGGPHNEFEELKTDYLASRAAAFAR
jgi:hypothetical protein